LILREAYYLSEIQSSEIYIKLIEGIRLYSDIVKEEKEKKERDRKTVVELDYENAINSEGISALVKYIQSYRGWDWDDYFNEDSYAEIARRLTNDRNIKFNRIGNIKNPYAFGKNTIYFYPYYIKVNQWMENGNLLCFLDDDVFIIERVPDIKNIGEFIRNAYLQYNGTGTLTFVDGRKEVIALFDLIYSFD
jgi:hypothetical protein